MEGATATLQTITANVGQLTTAATSMFTAFSNYWFVYLPITFVIFRFCFKTFKSLLMYRGRKGRG